MTGVDIEMARAILVIGLVLSAMLYNVSRIASGGIVTGPYLALMVLGEQWLTIAGWVVLSLVGIAAVTWAAKTWPLPRAWLFAIAVLVPAGVHVLLMWLAGAPALSNLSPYLAAGLYVTNGLTAYDAKRQGTLKTFTAAAGVGLITYLVILPLGWALEEVRDRPPLVSAPSLQEPLLVFATIAIALAVRVALGWGSAGIIGALFFVDLLNPTSAIVVVAMALIGAVIYRAVARYVGLSPKQRLYSIMIVSAIASWFGLFWADWWGIPGAEIAQQYAVEPLLVTGLMVSETVRRGIPRMLGGGVLVVGLTFVAQWLLAEHPRGGLFVILGLVALVVWAFGFAAGAMRNTWIRVLRESDHYGPDNPGQKARYHPRRVARVDRERRHHPVAFRPVEHVALATSVALVVVFSVVGYVSGRPDQVVTQDPGQLQVNTVDVLALQQLVPELESAERVRIVGFPLSPRFGEPAVYPRPLAAQVETYLRKLAGERSSDIQWLVTPDATTTMSWVLTPKTVVEVFVE
ncbi:poly-gamma-glutamate biosynthesis protein CapC [Pontimonas salivibrio]|uniref:Poly-gamma-glutamate biosynthesis protein CapC n=1 Tax=Pontimonas salivibrio TaxID=1159327 RepID=A0A2L2BN29_9MICO|nr:poly-gamma-glutamate biosynthesis protein PgsC/CapC [Pontimonas salivibrio]AVG23061.1 poly-gamma-glutamate biosynthesis protein CapC [Pontimonas salivibrio]